jgi:uncharacterized membrane protein
MKTDRTPVTVLLLLAALAAIQFAHYYGRLPDTIAVHFGAGGQPNSWSGKGQFIALYGGIEALIILLGLGTASIMDRIPPSVLSIPNAEHWLGPERREASVRFLRAQIIWLEAITLGFLIALAQLIFAINLREGRPALPEAEFWVIMVVFVGAVVGMSVRIIARFRRPRV